MHTFTTRALIGAVAAGAALATAGCSSSAAKQPEGPPAAHTVAPPTDSVLTVGGGGPSDPAGPPSSASASAPAATAVPDACTLITHAEAQQLVHTTLRKGEDHPSANPQGIASCSYDAPVTGTTASVQLYAQNGIPNALVDDRTQGGKFVKVAGIGDQTLDEPGANSIFVRKGTLWVYVNIPYGTTPAKLVSAARLVASRLH